MSPSGGSRISLKCGCQHTILPNFPQNCKKLKEFGPLGARPCAPLDPSLSPSVTNQHKTKHPAYCNIYCVLFKVSIMCSYHFSTG